LLRIAEFITGQDHWRSLRHEQRRQQIQAVTAALTNDFFVIAVTLNAVVAAVVVRMPVTVVFAIRFIVTVDIADRITQRETVMCGDEIHAGHGSAAAGFENIGGAMQAPRQHAALAGVASPELSNTVTIDVVPLGPARREIPELVAARARVPGLGNQFDVRQSLVVADVQ
jgi:hypothetical protein